MSASRKLNPDDVPSNPQKTQDENTEHDIESVLRFVEKLKRQWVKTIDSLVDPLLLINKDYEIKKSNTAILKIAGAKSFTEVLDRKCYEVFADRSSPCVGCTVNNTFAKNVASEFQLENGKNNSYYEVIAQPIVEDNEVDQVVITYRDRTEKVAMQKQLMQSKKLASIGLLAGGIAHEINNPLGGILVFSQMILREMDKKDPHYEDITEIENAAQRCKDIVDNLLEFARQKRSPKKDSQKESVSVKACIEQSLRFLQFGIKGDEPVEIKNKITKDYMVKVWDKNKIIQVFLNLFQNATHAMKKKRRIEIFCKEKTVNGKPYVVVAVKDYGKGIAEADLEKIFDPFFTTKEPGEGTGLGLALSYGIISELGGDITVSSEKNRGSTFYVQLPVA